jgi:hypothetical protein
LILGCLERFGGYTLTTILEEDTEILKLLYLESFGERAQELERTRQQIEELQAKTESNGGD